MLNHNIAARPAEAVAKQCNANKPSSQQECHYTFNIFNTIEKVDQYMNHPKMQASSSQMYQMNIKISQQVKLWM